MTNRINFDEIQMTQEKILRTVETLFDPGRVVELRILHRNKRRIDSGYFNDFEALANCAANCDHTQDVTGIYITLNPVDPRLLSRAANKVRAFATDTTKDKEVLERRLLLVDLDSTRPTGISATDEEIEFARDRAFDVAIFLREMGYSDPFIGFSGNGYHLLYSIQMPNNDASTETIKNLLNVLALKFNDENITVDTSVHNASRISKLYGTMARKGDDTADRPHRRAVLEGRWIADGD